MDHAVEMIQVSPLSIAERRGLFFVYSEADGFIEKSFL